MTADTILIALSELAIGDRRWIVDRAGCEWRIERQSLYYMVVSPYGDNPLNARKTFPYSANDHAPHSTTRVQSVVARYLLEQMP